jgi:hypothetical protein
MFEKEVMNFSHSCNMYHLQPSIREPNPEVERLQSCEKSANSSGFLFCSQRSTFLPPELVQQVIIYSMHVIRWR